MIHFLQFLNLISHLHKEKVDLDIFLCPFLPDSLPCQALLNTWGNWKTPTNLQQAIAARESQLWLSWFANSPATLPWRRSGKVSAAAQVLPFTSLLLSIATPQTKTHHADLKEQDKSTFYLLQHRQLISNAFLKGISYPSTLYRLVIFNIYSKTWIRNYSCNGINGKHSSYVSEIKISSKNTKPKNLSLPWVNDKQWIVLIQAFLEFLNPCLCERRLSWKSSYDFSFEVSVFADSSISQSSCEISSHNFLPTI